MGFRLLLLDLDGTLVDTAPDMAGACNAVRAEEGLDPVPVEALRNYVSRGALGVLDAGMPPARDEQHAARRHQRFLEVYREQVADRSRLFPGMEAVLTAFDGGEQRWGVVTNKPEWLARPLLDALGLLSRSAVLVGGDTLPERKPHPLPLIHAAAACGTAPQACLYVGDDERDVISGRAAGMTTAIALWGYILPGEEPSAWGADWECSDPGALLERLEAIA
ncbi:MAG: phosphoglycolate phosphatase [Xanthomonadales bacterium]|nr:phosphoglycolate phosphatase [Xanthomonadales bacterium]